MNPVATASQTVGPYFHLAGGKLGVDLPLRPVGHLARDGDHVFRPDRAGQLLNLLAAFGADGDLGLAVPVAQVQEQPAAMVAVTIDPAAHRDFLADVPGPQLATRMSPDQMPILKRSLTSP